MYRILRCRLLALASLGVAAMAGAQITESPVTVAPGRFLLEMDAISLTLDRADGAKYTAFGAASTFLSTGLAQHWDIQLGAELFISQKYEDGSFRERRSGIGDVYLRTKWRFLDDPESGSAAAVIPFVKIPTNSGRVGNRSVEGGLIVPWSIQLIGGLDFAAMVEVDFLRNDADDGYDTHGYASASLTRSVTKRVALYAEAAVGKSSGAGPAEGVVGGGVTVAFSGNSWWDVAVYRGISRGAADWNHVIRYNWGF